MIREEKEKWKKSQSAVGIFWRELCPGNQGKGSLKIDGMNLIKNKKLRERCVIHIKKGNYPFIVFGNKRVGGKL